jgi:hypothetical protein
VYICISSRHHVRDEGRGHCANTTGVGGGEYIGIWSLNSIYSLKGVGEQDALNLSEAREGTRRGIVEIHEIIIKIREKKENGFVREN